MPSCLYCSPEQRIICSLLSHYSCPTLYDPMDCNPPCSSVGFSRQEHWSGLPFSSPGDLPDPGVKLVSPAPPTYICKWILYQLSHLGSPCVHAKLLHSCLTLCDPVDCSLPGSYVLGILQARELEWIAMPSSGVSFKPRD